MTEQHEPRDDPALAAVWQEMDETERLRLLLAQGEAPPAELSDAVKRMYDEQLPEA